MFSTKTAFLIGSLFVVMLGCAKTHTVNNDAPGGVLAIPIRINANIDQNQYVLLTGNKPYPFRIKVYPILAADGTCRPKGAYNDFAFSEKLSPGVYEIEEYSYHSKSNTILTLAQEKSADLLQGRKTFEIADGRLTMLDRVLQITGTHSNDRALRLWNGENIGTAAFEDFTTFLDNSTSTDHSYRIWRWLNFNEGEFLNYARMLSIEQAADYWIPKLRPAPKRLTSDHTEVNRVGNIIVFSGGIIEDSDTRLMWSDRDNGFDLTWHTASKYCENYTAGGYSDWRLPTAEELVDIQRKNIFGNSEKSGLIDTHGIFLWTSEKRVSSAQIFSGAGLVDTNNGNILFFHPANKIKNRVIPVRNVHRKSQ
ncbi:MAG: DUF1566 domain-containing protein [Desulforhopalus sp.]